MKRRSFILPMVEEAGSEEKRVDFEVEGPLASDDVEV